MSLPIFATLAAMVWANGLMYSANGSGIVVDRLKVNNGLHLGQTKFNETDVTEIATIITHQLQSDTNCTACIQKETPWPCQEYACVKKGVTVECAVVPSAEGTPCLNGTGECSGDLDSNCIITGVSYVSSANTRHCLTRIDGVGYCWGELERFNYGIKSYPTKFQELVGCVKVIVNDVSISCLTVATTVKTKGGYNPARLGRGTPADYLVLKEVNGVGGVGILTNIRDIQQVGNELAAFDYSDNVIGWGDPIFVCISTGYDYFPRYIPGKDGVGYLTGVKKMSMMIGYDFYYALTTDGNLFTWGNNYKGDDIIPYPKLIYEEVVDAFVGADFVLLLNPNSSVTNVHSIRSYGEGGILLSVSDQVSLLTRANKIIYGIQAVYGSWSDTSYLLMNDTRVIAISAIGMGDEENDGQYKHMPGVKNKGIVDGVKFLALGGYTIFAVFTDGRLAGATSMGRIGDGTYTTKNVLTYVTWNIYRK